MQPPLIAKRYQLTDESGRGGMAALYRATDLQLNRTVAIKLIPPPEAGTPSPLPGHSDWEPQALAQVNHHNIIQIYDSKPPGSTPGYLVMEFIEGVDLQDLLVRDGPLPINIAFTVLAYVLDALEHCHQHGLIHRDLKPANLMLEYRTGRVVLLDFGLASPLSPQSPPPDALVGTPEFLSPEQVLKRPLGPEVDLFCFGSLAYTLLCGRSPFEDPDPVEVMRRIIDVEYTPVSDVNPKLPPAVNSLIAGCLTSGPETREPSSRIRHQLGKLLGKGQSVPSEKTIHTWLLGRPGHLPDPPPV